MVSFHTDTSHPDLRTAPPPTARRLWRALTSHSNFRDFRCFLRCKKTACRRRMRSVLQCTVIAHNRALTCSRGVFAPRRSYIELNNTKSTCTIPPKSIETYSNIVVVCANCRGSTLNNEVTLQSRSSIRSSLALVWAQSSSKGFAFLKEAGAKIFIVQQQGNSHSSSTNSRVSIDKLYRSPISLIWLPRSSATNS